MAHIRQILANLSISVADFKKSPKTVIKAAKNEPIAVIIDNKPAFYCVPADILESLYQKVYEMNDMALQNIERLNNDVSSNLSAVSTNDDEFGVNDVFEAIEDQHAANRPIHNDDLIDPLNTQVSDPLDEEVAHQINMSIDQHLKSIKDQSIYDDKDDMLDDDARASLAESFIREASQSQARNNSSILDKINNLDPSLARDFAYPDAQTTDMQMQIDAAMKNPELQAANLEPSFDDSLESLKLASFEETNQDDSLLSEQEPSDDSLAQDSFSALDEISEAKSSQAYSKQASTQSKNNSLQEDAETNQLNDSSFADDNFSEDKGFAHTDACELLGDNDIDFSESSEDEIEDEFFMDNSSSEHDVTADASLNPLLDESLEPEQGYPESNDKDQAFNRSIEDKAALREIISDVKQEIRDLERIKHLVSTPYDMPLEQVARVYTPYSPQAQKSADKTDETSELCKGLQSLARSKERKNATTSRHTTKSKGNKKSGVGKNKDETSNNSESLAKAPCNKDNKSKSARCTKATDEKAERMVKDKAKRKLKDSKAKSKDTSDVASKQA